MAHSYLHPNETIHVPIGKPSPEIQGKPKALVTVPIAPNLHRHEFAIPLDLISVPVRAKRDLDAGIRIDVGFSNC